MANNQRIPPRRLCGAMVADTRQLELNPELRSSRLALETRTRERRATDTVARRGSLTIPIIVHVVYKTNEENISDNQVQSQINVLNQDFRAINTDLNQIPAVWSGLATDSQVNFTLADIKRTQTDQDIFSDDDGMKFPDRGGSAVVDPARNINIWVCNLDPWLGYAYFPGVDPAIDGVVIGYRWFGTEGNASQPYNLGRTATHELGHYLNLFHVWGGDSPSCGDSDFVDDTPNQARPNYNKPQFPHISCGNGPSGDMFMNYMDYVDDDSMYMFTAQQVVRMRTALGEARPNLGQA